MRTWVYYETNEGEFMESTDGQICIGHLHKPLDLPAVQVKLRSWYPIWLVKFLVGRAIDREKKKGKDGGKIPVA